MNQNSLQVSLTNTNYTNSIFFSNIIFFPSFENLNICKSVCISTVQSDFKTLNFSSITFSPEGKQKNIHYFLRDEIFYENFCKRFDTSSLLWFHLQKAVYVFCVCLFRLVV